METSFSVRVRFFYCWGGGVLTRSTDVLSSIIACCAGSIPSKKEHNYVLLFFASVKLFFAR
jgi:hypothetical protein